MARSLRKGPYIDERLAKKLAGMKPGDKQAVKTWSRGASITPEMVGFAFGVHNGKQFVQVQIAEDMVGHKLGEFSPTTKFSRHGGRMQKELEQKQTEAEQPGVAPTGKPGVSASAVVKPGKPVNKFAKGGK
ncbi:MAG TPA: 30S ribosomal protein S19 [Candidatus Paceibacterota bacterium]